MKVSKYGPIFKDIDFGNRSLICSNNHIIT